MAMLPMSAIKTTLPSVVNVFEAADSALLTATQVRNEAARIRFGSFTTDDRFTPRLVNVERLNATLTRASTKLENALISSGHVDRGRGLQLLRQHHQELLNARTPNPSTFADALTIAARDTIRALGA